MHNTENIAMMLFLNKVKKTGRKWLRIMISNFAGSTVFMVD